MPTILTLQSQAGIEFQKSFPDPALKVPVENPPQDSNTFTWKRVDQLAVGDFLSCCDTMPDVSNEITALEVIDA